MKTDASLPEVLLRLNENQIALAEAISICVKLAVASDPLQAIIEIKHCLSLVDTNHFKIIETIEDLNTF